MPLWLYTGFGIMRKPEYLPPHNAFHSDVPVEQPPPTKSPTSFAFLSGRFNNSGLNISPVAPIVLNPPFTNLHQPTTWVNNVLEIVFVHFLRHFDTNLLLRFIWVQNSDVFLCLK